MFENNKIKELILSTLVADSYSLGAHWVYDDKQLEKLDINWEELNEPKAIWHKGKVAGDFTHIGDQAYWLYQFLEEKSTFDADSYIDFWKNKMNSYNGYIDGATRETLENLKDKKSPSGSSSTDLSIIGRITPLLLVSNTKEEFLKNVEDFVKCTHNSNEAIVASRFFAKLLLKVLEGNEIDKSILELKEQFDTKIQGYIAKAINSKTASTFESIRNFGPACDIDGGFEGVIHLLSKYDNLKQMLIQNAKAGGDSSARGMIAAMIFMAQKDKNIKQVPSSWLNIKAKII